MAGMMDAYSRPLDLGCNNYSLDVLLSSKCIEANASEILGEILTESEDDIAALRQQNTALKKFCQALKDEQDAALINYAVAEGKLMTLNMSKFEGQCQNCCLKDGRISHLEEQVEEARLEREKLIDQISHLERQLEDIKLENMRLHQYEKKKKRNRKVSQPQQQECHNGPVLSPTMESVPVRNPNHMPQTAVIRAAGVEEVCALKDVLYKNDQLVEDLASSFEPTCIQGKPGSWISLCNHLNITSANLFHIDAKSRLLDILKEYEKSSEHDISVRELYNIFTEVGNKNSACRLLKVAQLHAIPDDRSHRRSRHKTLYKAKANSEDVCDSDLDSSSSEDSVVV